jgi:alcohol dehydrogenase (cytochrome c)
MKNSFLFLVLAAVATAQVPYQRIHDAAKEPGNWLTYSGNYAGHRHSPLTELTPKNVGELKPAWVYQSREAGKVETSPIVIDGVLYVTEHPHVVTALDGKTGRPLWTYRRTAVNDVPTCCGPVNRGLAVLDDTLYLGTLDGHLVALDLRTGKQRWDILVADYKTGHSLTAAPLAVKDKIIVGISGGEFGIRGFLDAYDAKTGKLVWRLWTVPGAGEKGNETWGGGDWQHGGAPTWVTGTYDPELNLLYWGTGNPGPDYNGDSRPGDNLYSDSVLAINPDTGTLSWYFQYTPHDLHDWDSNQVPVLADLVIDGKPRKVLMQANRNAFYYTLDRETGEFIAGAAYAKQTWAEGLDAHGRPIVRKMMEPSPEGVLVYPGLAGGTNWFSPSYSPQTKLFYVQAQEDYAQVFYKLQGGYEPGEHFEGGGTRNLTGKEPYGVVKAIDPTTAKIRWEFKLQAEPSGGVLTTAGGLVFSGNREGNFFALDAETGKSLWHFQTGGVIWANPIGFEIDGRQYVSIASGSAIYVFAR